MCFLVKVASLEGKVSRIVGPCLAAVSAPELSLEVVHLLLHKPDALLI